MKLLFVDYILTCNEEFEIIKNGAVCFDGKIIDLGPTSEMIVKYKDVKMEKLPKNSVLMPGLINPHTHLEFSSNIATLTYGSFIPWLNSVIKNRESLMEKFDEELTKEVLDNLLKSGTTTIGNISSFGVDLAACKSAKQKIVYFVEAIGSHPEALDALYGDFLARAYEAIDNEGGGFTPALSIHSPYSTHRLMAKKVAMFAAESHLLVSTHFMESYAEREWIDNGSGEFKTFFSTFNPEAKPLYCNGIDFLKTFKDIKSLFTHCVYASEEELKYIADIDSSITHCPTSNRLLGCGALRLSHLEDNLLSLGTDGLSSNTSLSLWDEMRNALYLHENYDLKKLAKILINASTLNGGKSLGIKSGSLQKDFYSDIITFCLKEAPADIDELPLQIILQTKVAQQVYINGEEQL